MAEKLKPCPFCGGVELVVSEYWPDCAMSPDSYYVVCKDCWAETEAEPIRADAIANWNRRTAIEATLKPTDREREALERLRNLEPGETFRIRRGVGVNEDQWWSPGCNRWYDNPVDAILAAQEADDGSR